VVILVKNNYIASRSNFQMIWPIIISREKNKTTNSGLDKELESGSRSELISGILV